MKDNFGAEFIMGMLELHKKAEEAPWALKKHDLPKGKWRRVIDPDEGAEEVSRPDKRVSLPGFRGCESR